MTQDQFFLLLSLENSSNIKTLTLKGRGYFTNEKDGGGAIMAPPPVYLGS